jgi:hypothetical protein
MDHKTILAIIAVVIGLIGYVPYFRDIFLGKTKPHVFSWSVWGLLGTIAFFAQLSRGGGVGTAATALTAIGCFIIAGLAIAQKDKQIAMFDWIALAGAIFGITLWIMTKNPLLAVICVTVADTIGFLPTYRKAYFKPNEETPTQFIFASVKWVVSTLALTAFNPTTLIYPVVLIFTNGIFALMVLIRRHIIKID